VAWVGSSRVVEFVLGPMGAVVVLLALEDADSTAPLDATVMVLANGLVEVAAVAIIKVVLQDR
jgi:hypothetical protein